MKKGTVFSCLFLAVLLAVYHVIVFLVPFTRTPVFWTSYGFTLMAFAIAAVSFYLAFLHDGATIKSRLYGFPVARIGVIYLAVQVVACFIFIIVGRWVPLWVVLVIYILMMGAAALGLITTEAVAEEINRQDGAVKARVSFMKSLQVKMNSVLASCDASVSGEVKKVADELRYSDPTSSRDTAKAEAELSALIDELSQAVSAANNESVRTICRKCHVVLMERNQLCKLSK